MKLLFVSAILMALSSTAHAGFKGNISFTPAEVQTHQAGLNTIIRDAADCLEEHLDRHQSFYHQWGISPYYGSMSSFSKLTTQERRDTLTSLGKPASLLSQMEATSCVGLTMTCLGRGFKKAGQADLWAKIATFTRANGVDGEAIQHSLRLLGWKVLYWNPNPARNEAWDDVEKSADPTNSHHFWGYHALRYATATGPQHMYYANHVDDWTTLVGFGTRIPAAFANVPFFVGTAHTGYHVFPGSRGRVTEGHSTRQITDPQTIETSPFNPIADGGGPRGEYKTGPDRDSARLRNLSVYLGFPEPCAHP